MTARPIAAGALLAACLTCVPASAAEPPAADASSSPHPSADNNLMTSHAIHHPPTMARRMTDEGQAPEQVTALVIDDDAMMRLLVRETLEGVGRQRAS